MKVKLKVVLKLLIDGQSCLKNKKQKSISMLRSLIITKRGNHTSDLDLMRTIFLCKVITIKIKQRSQGLRLGKNQSMIGHLKWQPQPCILVKLY